MTLAEINAMTETRFIETLGSIYEHSPWVARRAWPQKPFPHRRGLHQAMSAVVREASWADQVELIRAHPDLGTRAQISEASTAEQAGAGLQQLTEPEFRRLSELNSAYRSKFGFPFIFAVKGSNKQQILEALEQRLNSTPADERATALAEIDRIAGWRLDDLIAEEA